MKFFIPAEHNNEDISGVIVEITRDASKYYIDLVELVKDLHEKHKIFMVEILSKNVPSQYVPLEHWLLNHSDFDEYCKSKAEVPLTSKEFADLTSHPVGHVGETTVCIETDGIFFTMLGFTESVWSKKLSIQGLGWASQGGLM